MVKLLNALNTYGVLADDKNLDFLVDILRAIKYVPKPQDAPCSDGCGDPKSCVTFYPWHGAFEFFPGLINGVDTPPEGYAQHPWFTGDRYVVPGFTLNDTDVLLDFVSSRPDGSITGIIEQVAVSGLPRFRFTFEALTAGKAYIHLLDVPLGGYALVRLDEIQDIDLLITDGLSLDDLIEAVGLIGQVVDDLIDLDPAELIPEHIHELSFGPGTHTIDVLFLPRLELPNLTAIGWGGGIRKIVICGEETVCPDPEEDMPRTELRSIPDPENAGCKIIQWKYENEGETLWRNLATVCDGADGPIGPSGPQGPAGECECPDPADDDRNIPAPENVPEGCALARRLANHIADAYVRWANDIAYALYNQGRSAADLAASMEEWLYAGSAGIFKSIIFGDEYEFDSWSFVVSNAFSLPLAGGVFWSNIIALVNGYQALDVLDMRDRIDAARDGLTCAWIDALDEDLLVIRSEYDGFQSALDDHVDSDVAQQLRDFLKLVPLSRIRALARTPNDDEFDCEVCNFEYDWCREFDFTIDERGWTTPNTNFQVNEYLAGQGWRSSIEDWYIHKKMRSLGIRRHLASSTHDSRLIKAVQVFYAGAPGENPGNMRVQLRQGFVTTHQSEQSWDGRSLRTFVLDTPALCNNLSVYAVVGLDETLPTTDPGGEMIVSKVKLFGVGTPPPASWQVMEEC
jgi:hypothetical protein